MKQTYLINLAVWFGFLIILSSCTDNYMYTSENGKLSMVSLQLPRELEVSINTRADNDVNTIDDILVVLYRNNQPLYQRFLNPIINGGVLSLVITDFQVQLGEILYVYCNTGLSEINATSADELANQIVMTNDAKKLPMYGSGKANGGGLSVELVYTLAKATLSCSAPGFSINSWKVCNVPSQGFVAGRGYPSHVNFRDEVFPTNEVAYFIPRSDNSNAGKDRTYILVQMSDQKWYKLDFYNHNGHLNIGEKVPVLDIQKNTHYSFEITEIKSAGYTTEEEAAANDGSNVVYNMEMTNGNAVSNGQYSLQFDREQIVLYPVDDQHNEMEVVTIFALIPKPENVLSTYYVLVHSPKGDIKILDKLSQPTDSLDLMNGESLTTENSSRTIKLQFSSANVHDAYLEVHLGNIAKKVPITMESSNCYLMDFASQTQSRLIIPVIQANKDGVNRILPDYDLDACIVWSDQPNVTEDNLHVTYNKEKQWIEVVNDIKFTGNVIVAVQYQKVIKWSWHIWALDANVLTFDSKHGVYDFLPGKTNVFNDYVFMDRNLGAYTLEKDGRVSDGGLQYQWGRKDPFPVAENTKSSLLTPLTIYHNGTPFTMVQNHPVWGTCMATQNSKNNLEYSIQNPIRMILGNFVTSPNTSGNGDGDNYDWYTNDYSLMDNNLWLSRDLKKTAYNPCPIGWTVPYGGQIGPWYGLHVTHASLNNDNGISFPDAGYFPYTPYYNSQGLLRNTAEMDQPNRSAFLWWGYYNNNRNSLTAFYDYLIHVSSIDMRGATHSVRCVRE